MTRYDAIIIGTGQAGPSLAAKLVGVGMNVAIIERKRFGGTCVNTGCIPTKTLVASARVAYVAQRAKDFGVEISGPVKVDMKKVKERKDQISGASSQGVEKWLKEMKGCKVYEGHARFVSPKQVEVNGETLEADKIFINVGGKASTPKIPGIESVPFMNNSSMMDVDFLPEHLVILGGSYISLEFAQMYRRFGSEVTVIERGPRILSKDDEDVSDEIRKIVENEGIQVITNTGEFSVEKRGDKVAVIMQCEGKPREVEGSHFFLAVGRVPNTKDLGLDKAGVKISERGFIEVDDQLRTNVEGIWALGDCNGKGAFTHTSYNDFEIVAANLLDNDPRKVTDRILAYNLYIDPPLGRVGMTEKQVRESGKKALIGKMPMTRVGRAKEKGETQGFMKILIDAETKQILGAAILGIGGDEIIHSIIDIMYAKAPYTVIQRAMHIHPTVTELIPTLLGELKPLYQIS